MIDLEGVMAQCMNDNMIPTKLAEIIVASVQLSRFLSKMEQWLLGSNCHWAEEEASWPCR